MRTLWQRDVTLFDVIGIGVKSSNVDISIASFAAGVVSFAAQGAEDDLVVASDDLAAPVHLPADDLVAASDFVAADDFTSHSTFAPKTIVQCQLMTHTSPNSQLGWFSRGLSWCVGISMVSI